MNTQQYEHFLRENVRGTTPMVSVAHVGEQPRTLAIGVNLTGDFLHSFVKDGLIHAVTFTMDRDRDMTTVTDHLQGASIPRVRAVPGLLTFPEHTDLLFAQVMRDAGVVMRFADFNFDADVTGPFLGPVA